ncbi:GNAT family N-acetyltransferase [Novosphingobium album (ex Liu et al. 2023)]|uniref:GNAT family N-acetyltransferase n=1 Tax=Novosphingobium album (ex Liu et al. 2023) TaxID=3031130 RepID=A0ABT5WNW7_9SPHN|nr:GNAT family N-acetyltransferase [Novosphingobium album (ex Liu et al. 2023)]MDE8651723.1 GNAT family N-acetyltransferase [Novosphingobium album (ex Liu et al. 2023)]
MNQTAAASLASASALTIARADYRDPADAAALVALLDAYARDPMGGGEPLRADVRQRLAPALAQVPGAFSFLAREEEEPVGLINCFTGFSTFAARPLVNVHDLVVLPGRRGKGLGRMLMAAAEREAMARGACKLTLEVLANNTKARALYAALGYNGYALGPDAGSALFWEKKLP